MPSRTCYDVVRRWKMGRNADIFRPAIGLDIRNRTAHATGATRFGGRPDVPDGFSWPSRRGRRGDLHHLCFMAQFDCRMFPALDKSGLLPQTGVLSFFYDMTDQPWGISPEELSGGRVFWFGDETSIHEMEYPDNLDGCQRFPMLGIDASSFVSMPSAEDFFLMFPDQDFSSYAEACSSAGIGSASCGSQLLGWPSVIQDPMPVACELLSNGYAPTVGWKGIPAEVVRKANGQAVYDWQLLFQLDMVESDGFSLMLGDCGMLYYFIRREDLLMRRFDRVVTIVQCC